MRGKQVFMESLIAHGVEYIFGNPGTTESPILDALLDYPQLRYVVALHEGVALGAASYYAQTSGKPAVVNVHVAPGLGNALGMLYNALQGALAAASSPPDSRTRACGCAGRCSATTWWRWPRRSPSGACRSSAPTSSR